MKLSFSLNKPKQPLSTPSIGPSAAFALDNDDRIDAAPTAAFADRNTAGNKKLLAHGVESSKGKRKRAEDEKMEEVYDYDGAWDSIQAERLRQKEAKTAETKERKVRSPLFLLSIHSLNYHQPKYIHGLLSSAATRKLDHLRAEEKMIQIERAAEGDEFNDKEAFVTQAYRDQMAEVRRAEEEEKRREGMSHLAPFLFYQPNHAPRTAEEDWLQIIWHDSFLSQVA
jgi:coiled-coil domain-containing protein 55